MLISVIKEISGEVNCVIKSNKLLLAFKSILNLHEHQTSFLCKCW